ncbi:CpsB/CapC family capsule biosynthesis tyrosine phosphatase [Candidatus Stoquefichus massiliensis]|uniref:CpsB/CapC family capsule biosynthesis tyrosine phosphatase n=1 Tax=Candidatus Stoquefichus massiliensis TaxID=1470350 RepID=UPI000489F95E|nr:CpsB/CapC family capsule biosynthesis tyrosine phosphatase [Candidatus Stoquefichus massiliensis]
MQFIDIHGHYAWDIDDGIQTKEDAIKALNVAKANNITSIVATPHVIPGAHTKKDIEHLKERIQELKQLAQNNHIDVYQGCELFLNHDCIQSLQNGLYIPIENTSYLLVEFDVRKELGSQDEVEDYLYEIEVAGYTPVIAHVERYFKDELDIERISDFVESGYVIQVNASSLLGVHGKTVKNNAYRLIDKGLAHIIATDTHRCEGHRIPRMQETFDILSKSYHYQVLKTLMFDNPQHILHNEEVEEIEIKKSFLKKLLTRR